MNFLESIDEYNTAMHNAYLVVTGKRSLESFTKDLSPMLPLDFNNKGVLVDSLIDHYSDMEEYDKCDELSNLKDV
tara:strand:- start:700 stop:924 length:225 start_codon:yes stop_codon:yes gene_type:complete